MIEYIMRFDEDDSGKLINARRMGKIVRCRDCINRQHDTIFNISWCNGKAVKPDGYCNEGRRE